MGFKYGNLEGTRKPFHVGTGADEASAQLQVDSTTRGLLPPRMTTAQRVAISTPAEGLLVFDTNFNACFVFQAASWHQYASIPSANTFTGVNKFENVAGIEVGKDAATNTAGLFKLWSAGANDFYTTFTAGTQSANATYTLPTAMPGVSGYVLSCTNAGVMSWAAAAAATVPAGSTTQIQFNNAGAFGADSEFIWDNVNKRLKIGVTASTDSGDNFSIQKDSSASIGLVAAGDTNSSIATYSAQRSRGTLAAKTDVAAEDILLKFTSYGYKNANWRTAGAFQLVTESVGTNIVSGYWQFSTANTAGTLAERMRITSAGEVMAYLGVVPDANDGAYLGTTALGWSDLFLASGGVINWANGNSTITHATGILTFAGCKLATGGETAPDVDAGGLCLNHGAGVDSVLTIKSSDVAHPFTSLAQADTYGEMRRHVSASGGLLIRGFTEATTGLEYRGYTVTASTGDFAAIQMTSYLTDGATGVTALTPNSNIVGFRNNAVMKHQFKGGGDAVFVGALTVGARVATTPPAGTIQWSSTAFQGYDGALWRTFDNHWIVPADHSWSGNTITATAGETVAMGDLCYLKSDGSFWLADADAQVTADGMLAMATAAIVGAATGVFLLRGFFRDDTWTWTIGGALYVNTTMGAPTQTAPSATGDIVRIVGHAYSTDVIYFSPDNTFVELT